MWYGIQPSDITPQMRDVALEITNVRDGSVALCLGRVEIAEALAIRRQAALERSFDSMFAVIDGVGIDAAFLTRTSSSLTWWLTFDPETQSVGVALSPEILAKLGELRADLFLTVSPPG